MAPTPRAYTYSPNTGSTSVVICAYTVKRWQQLVEAVDSVRAQSPAPDEIIVVIDHNDELRSIAAKALPDARVIPNAGPQGLSGARNTGIRAARSDIVCFLDDDAVAQDGWLVALTSCYSDASVVGTGGTALPQWEKPPPAWLPEEFYWVVGCTHRGLPTTQVAVRNPIGCNMSFRRVAFDRAGGFDTQIGRIGARPLGCEETEFAIRLQAQDVTSRVILVPFAAVHHLVTADRLRFRYFISRCWSEGLSKALVASLVGSRGALASERSYVRRTLPRGVLTGVRSGRPAGFARAGAIVVGLAITTLGYLRGTITLKVRARHR